MSAAAGTPRAADAMRRRRGSAQPSAPVAAAPPTSARRRGSSAAAYPAAPAAAPSTQQARKKAPAGDRKALAGGAELAKGAAGTPRGSGTRGPRKSAAQQGEPLLLVIAIAGTKFPVQVPRHAPCEALVTAAVAEYQARFPGIEVPDCNEVFHNGKQAYLIPSETLGSCCHPEDEIELRISRAVPSTVSSEHLDGASDAGSVNAELPPYEFCVVFHRLPLGFSMKQSNGQTVVANIYANSAAMHYRRLVSGVVITEIAGTPPSGLRQAHELMRSVQPPFKIRFRGHMPPPMVADASIADGLAALGFPGAHFPGPGAQMPLSPRAARHRANSAGRRINASNDRSGSVADNQVDSAQPHSPVEAPNQDVPVEAVPRNLKDGEHPETPLSEASPSPVDSNQEETYSEEALSRKVDWLRVELMRKHEEARELARQLRMFEERLDAVRVSKDSLNPAASTVNPPPAPTSAPLAHTPATAVKDPPHSMPRTQSFSRPRLTPEVLEEMDKKDGLPSKGTGYYDSSNISSVSGYSNSSHRVRQSRTSRYSASNADNVSVSSHTSGTERRGTYPIKSPRNAAVKNISNRYNYMPQKYTDTSRGAVISRARASRDSFITRTESPGVGYYDVKVVDRVKGGEIGDADRHLPWS